MNSYRSTFVSMAVSCTLRGWALLADFSHADRVTQPTVGITAKPGRPPRGELC